ncbi:MAG: hypothetical protein IKD72_05415 [Clostridia bacterium]|nr:hypothetical protein [Clostridia bacterium]
MRIHRNSLFRLLSYVLPLALADVMNNDEIQRALRAAHPSAWYTAILHGGLCASTLILLVYLQWLFSLRRRFPQKQMRSNATAFAVLFMLLILLRAAKYTFVTNSGTAARYLWYAYYIPLIFGPLFVVRASLCFGKPDNHEIAGRWRWLYLPAALLAAGILTNDLHSWAFCFPQGVAHWEQYTYGPLYYVVSVWIALMVLSFVVLVVRSTVSRRLFKNLWLPVAVLGAVAAYHLVYAYAGDYLNYLKLPSKMNEFVCISAIAIWESLVAARVIVSNNDYPAIFAASSLNAGLADRALRVRQASVGALRPAPETLRAAQNGALLLPDGDTLLKLRHVQGGWFYWTENIAALRRLKEALQESSDYLEEENAMLRVTAEMDEDSRATAAHTQLYDRVTASLRTQLDTLSGWAETLPADDAAFRAALRRCSVLLAYCKRRSNLLLQAQTHPLLTGEELRLCFEESARALRLSEIPCDLSVAPDLNLPAESAAALYEAFETALEQTLPALAAVALSLTRKGENGACLAVTLTLRSGRIPAEELQTMRRAVEGAAGAQGSEIRIALTETAAKEDLPCV